MTQDNSKPVLSEAAMTNLPSDEDRSAFLSWLTIAASSVVESNSAVIPPTKDPKLGEKEPPSGSGNLVTLRSTESSSSSSAAVSSLPSFSKEDGKRQRGNRRLRTVLLADLPRIASAALLVVAPPDVGADSQGEDRSDRPDANGRELSQNHTSPVIPSDAVGCISLIVLNLLLLSGGAGRDGGGKGSGYDARIRQVVKSAAVEILSRKIDEEGGIDLEEENEAVAMVGGSEERRADDEDDKKEEEEEDKTENSGRGGSAVEEPKELSYFLDEIYEEKIQADACAVVLQGRTDDENPEEARQRRCREKATRKFEAIESRVATELVRLVLFAQKKKLESTSGTKPATQSKSADLARAAKIGAVGLAAGALFAVTGGLAAPGIAAGMAALGVGTSAAVVALTSHTAMVAMFGLGGGGLAAYKMKRRTDGLSEFRIRKEGGDNNPRGTSTSAASLTLQSPSLSSKLIDSTQAEVRSSVCVTGWLRDKFDFQRPWGVTPSDPLITMLELLQRFYSVHDPEKVTICPSIVKNMNEGDKEILWGKLRMEYGRDPDHLLPLDRAAYKLSGSDSRIIQRVVEAALNADGNITTGKTTTGKLKPASNAGRGAMTDGSPSERKPPQASAVSSDPSPPTVAGLETPSASEKPSEKHGPPTQKANTDHKGLTKSVSATLSPDTPPSQVVWDYRSQYGELYTITWESALLLSISQYVNEFARKLAKKGTKYVLKQTALATLMAAVSWPSTLCSFADGIDDQWALTTLRADEAGVELARSLLQSDEQRPVNLIGFSMGARIVYSCLKELARHQTLWEVQQSGDVGSSSGVSREDDITDGLESEKVGNLDTKKDAKKPADVLLYSREPASIVEDAILMGTPKFIEQNVLLDCRNVVAGRFINCYSPKDWILSLMFQYKCMTGIMRPTCGTAPITGVAGVENFDVSHWITTHSDYCLAAEVILDAVGYGQPMPINAKCLGTPSS